MEIGCEKMVKLAADAKFGFALVEYLQKGLCMG